MLTRVGKRLNIAGQRVVAAGTRRVGVLVTNIDNPFFSRLLNAIELSGRRRGVEIISAGSNYDLAHEERQLQMLSGSGADAFLVCPAHDVKSGAVLRRLNQPFVLIGRRVRELDADVIMVNDFEAGRMAARHLWEQHCRSFAYVGISNFPTIWRFGGFSMSCTNAESRFRRRTSCCRRERRRLGC